MAESDSELEFIEREKDSGIMSNNENTPERKLMVSRTIKKNACWKFI